MEIMRDSSLRKYFLLSTSVFKGLVTELKERPTVSETVNYKPDLSHLKIPFSTFCYVKVFNKIGGFSVSFQSRTNKQIKFETLRLS